MSDAMIVMVLACVLAVTAMVFLGFVLFAGGKSQERRERANHTLLTEFGNQMLAISQANLELLKVEIDAQTGMPTLSHRRPAPPPKEQPFPDDSPIAHFDPRAQPPVDQGD